MKKKLLAVFVALVMSMMLLGVVNVSAGEFCCGINCVHEMAEDEKVMCCTDAEALNWCSHILRSDGSGGWVRYSPCLWVLYDCVWECILCGLRTGGTVLDVLYGHVWAGDTCIHCGAFRPWWSLREEEELAL